MAQPHAKGKADSHGKRDPKKEAAGNKPPPEHVADFHTNADVDARPEAMHHTLGPSQNQAASGAHTHDASDPLAQPLWSGVDLTDPDASASTATLAAAIAQLNALIRQKSGG